MERLQRGNPRELDRAAMFGRIRQHLGRRQDSRHVVVGFGNGFAEMGDGVAQRRQLDAIIEWRSAR
jgi:hypothetical protein